MKVDWFRTSVGAPLEFNTVLFGGFLGSIFSFLQFIASPIIGGLSDRSAGENMYSLRKSKCFLPCPNLQTKNLQNVSIQAQMFSTFFLNSSV